MTLEQMYNEAKALVEDRTYNFGDISEKTGLQKTANGWRPPKGNKGNSSPKQEENKSKEQNSEQKASKMTYKEAESHLNEKQKELLNNMAKQNGKSIEEIYNEFKDVINFGKRDPKLMEELERSNRFKQEKMAKERQKKEDEIKQQRQEGEANARAFQEKVKRGEIVYNEKSGQFEEGPKEKKTNKKPSIQEYMKAKDLMKKHEAQYKKEMDDYEYMERLRANGVNTSIFNPMYGEKPQPLENRSSYKEAMETVKSYETTDNACRITADTKIRLKK